MRKNLIRSWTFATAFAALMAFRAIPAHADTILFDFADGDAGMVPSPLNFTEADETTLILGVTGWYFDGTGWQSSSLFRRKEAPNDVGLGVCNPDEQPCPGPPGGGDVNELDNNGHPELIRLELGSDYDWVSVSLSSLDTNDGSNIVERGILWGSNDGDPADLLSMDMLWQFEGGTSAGENPSFDMFTDVTKSYSYLFFEPTDWAAPEPTTLTTNSFTTTGYHRTTKKSGSTTTTTVKPNTNNDFLVHTAAVTKHQVPEPASLILLLAALGAIGLTTKKRG
jgi:PEP-CTERM motif